MLNDCSIYSNTFYICTDAYQHPDNLMARTDLYQNSWELERWQPSPAARNKTGLETQCEKLEEHIFNSIFLGCFVRQFIIAWYFILFTVATPRRSSFKVKGSFKSSFIYLLSTISNSSQRAELSHILTGI